MNKLPEDIEEAIGVAMGGVSMCWEPTPTGVFDSTRAKEIVERLCAAIASTYLASPRGAPPQPEQPYATVEKPWIPQFDIFGKLHPLKHPLQTSSEEKKKLSEFADKYVALRDGGAAASLTEQQERTMYDDMGKLLRMLIPSLDGEDTKLLGRGDRYRLIGEAFKAYDAIFEDIQKRNTLADTDKPSPEMEAAASSWRGIDDAPGTDVPS